MLGMTMLFLSRMTLMRILIAVLKRTPTRRGTRTDSLLTGSLRIMHHASVTLVAFRICHLGLMPSVLIHDCHWRVGMRMCLRQVNDLRL